jgi:hypothetical protein
MIMQLLLALPFVTTAPPTIIFSLGFNVILSAIFQLTADSCAYKTSDPRHHEWIFLPRKTGPGIRKAFRRSGLEGDYSPSKSGYPLE